MPHNTKEKKAAYMKEWCAKTKDKKAAYNKEYSAKNKDKRAVYQKTPQCIKSYKISAWKRIGIMYDFEKLYYLYINTHKCWVCKNKFKSGRDKSADHDHDINNGDNFRFILCHKCNHLDHWKKHVAANRIIKWFKYP